MAQQHWMVVLDDEEEEASEGTANNGGRSWFWVAVKGYLVTRKVEKKW